MTDPIRVLFIGGPMDGQEKILSPQDGGYYETIESMRPARHYDGDGFIKPMPEPIEVKKVKYECKPLRGKYKTFWISIPLGTDVGAAYAKLLESYILLKIAADKALMRPVDRFTVRSLSKDETS
jgi:hypothetical protein